MSSLLQSPLLIAGASFAAGWIIALLLALILKSMMSRSSDLNKPGQEHRIRALNAELRVTTHRAEELEEHLKSARTELESLGEGLKMLTATLEHRETELKQVRSNLIVECKKTAQLRRELTGRAEETIRAQAQIKDIETELDVAQAGSDVVAEHIHRLEAEREQLHDRLERSITGKIFEGELVEASEELAAVAASDAADGEESTSDMNLAGAPHAASLTAESTGKEGVEKTQKLSVREIQEHLDKHAEQFALPDPDKPAGDDSPAQAAAAPERVAEELPEPAPEDAREFGPVASEDTQPALRKGRTAKARKEKKEEPGKVTFILDS